VHDFWNALVLPLHSTLLGIVSFLPRFLVSSILFILFYGGAELMRAVALKSLERSSHIPWAVRLLVARIAYLVTVLIGLMVALSAANVNVTALIASLGVAGFALGFALKDILENFISGILLLFARPFEVDDQITVNQFEGTVISIDIRTTSLRTYDHQLVIIPNSQVFTNTVINHTRLGKRQYSVVFGTSLTANADEVLAHTLDAIHAIPDILTTEEPSVRVSSVDAVNDNMTWKATFWGDPLKATESTLTAELLTRIKKTIYDAGIPTPNGQAPSVVYLSDMGSKVNGLKPVARN
jgi:small-conductance mechanosensitive channel